jgi:dTDP-4-dehydrorhamnose reductase
MSGGDMAGVLIVGDGLIGRAVRAMLRAQGISVTSIGRRQKELPGYQPLELASEAGRRALRLTVDEMRPRCVLLVHGPSDVTWIEANAAAAAAVHGGVAEVAASSAAPVILISTDNVFPGTRGAYCPEDPVEPANGYGRVKSLAESAVLAGAPALVLRVSLVYGWAEAGLRSTFAQRCLQAAADGRPLSAPVDQSFTPVHVRDVAIVLAALCRSAVPVTGIRHLAGPAELSRYEFARLAFDLARADTSLVRPSLRRDTEWACRPRFSSLACGTFADLSGLETWQPMTPGDGLRDMLATRPAGSGLAEPSIQERVSLRDDGGGGRHAARAMPGGIWRDEPGDRALAGSRVRPAVP